jgi:hypothetical protein
VACTQLHFPDPTCLLLRSCLPWGAPLRSLFQTLQRLRSSEPPSDPLGLWCQPVMSSSSTPLPSWRSPQEAQASLVMIETSVQLSNNNIIPWAQIVQKLAEPKTLHRGIATNILKESGASSCFECGLLHLRSLLIFPRNSGIAQPSLLLGHDQLSSCAVVQRKKIPRSVYGVKRVGFRAKHSAKCSTPYAPPDTTSATEKPDASMARHTTPKSRMLREPAMIVRCPTTTQPPKQTCAKPSTHRTGCEGYTRKSPAKTQGALPEGKKRTLRPTSRSLGFARPLGGTRFFLLQKKLP